MRRPTSIVGLLSRLLRLRGITPWRLLLAVLALALGALAWPSAHDTAALRRPRAPITLYDAMAVAPAPGGWLLAWSRRADPAHELVVARLDPARWTVGEARVVARGPRPFARMQARWNGERFALVWQADYVAPGVNSSRLYLSFVDRAGVPLGTPRELGDGDQRLHPSLAWNGRHWGLAWSRRFHDDRHHQDETYHVAWRRLDAAGASVGPAIDLDETGYGTREVSVAPTPEGFAVAWTLDTYTRPPASFQTRAIAGDGRPGPLRTLDGLLRNHNHVAIARDADAFQVLQASVGSRAESWFTRGDGGLAATPTRLVAGLDDANSGVALASLGERSAVAWLRRVPAGRSTIELHLASLGRDGVLRSAPGRVRLGADYAGSQVSFGWDGRGLVLACFAATPEGLRRPFVARVDPATMAPDHSLPVGDWERWYFN